MVEKLEDFSFEGFVDLSYFLVNVLGWQLASVNEDELDFYDAISDLCMSKLNKKSRLNYIFKRIITNNLFMKTYSKE